MLRIAEVLEPDLGFVFVNLYATGDRVMFGEMPNYAEAANRRDGPGGAALLA